MSAARAMGDSVELEKTFAENYWQVQEQDIVCVPSLSFEIEEIMKITGSLHYEERQLFNILLLKNPKTRLIYITSVPIDPSIIQYYFSLLPSSVDRSDLHERLILLSTNDLTQRSLSAKVMTRPLFVQRIKKQLRPNCGILLCFNATNLECELAKLLDVPIFGNDCPQLGYWGSKSGSRAVFGEANIPHARGVGISHSSEELAKKIAFLYSSAPVDRMVVKLDYGFSGYGNALLDLSHITKSGEQISEALVLQSLSKMSFSCPHENWEIFQQKIQKMGAIAEEFLEGEDPKSPSVQGCISLAGDVEILSTHEQVLSGQVYQGCLFPASDSYRAIIQRYGRRIGRVLAKKGVRGHYGVDFLVKPPARGTENGTGPSEAKIFQNGCTAPDVYALEINLRQCGTTHPYFTMKLLTDGTYDRKTGLYHSSKGTVKYYTSSDNLLHEQYKGIIPQDVLDVCASRNLVFNRESQCGPAFHLLGALSEHGKVGITCIADSAEEAKALLVKVELVLEELGRIANPKVESPKTDPDVPRPQPKLMQNHVIPYAKLKQNSVAENEISIPSIEQAPIQLSTEVTSVNFGNSKTATNRLLITVCIHGDEVCGLHAVNELLAEGYFERNVDEGTSLMILLGNPLALHRNKRFVDQNLNRCLLPHMFEREGYETYRARRICEAIMDCDIFLDVHSSSADTPSMILPASNDQSKQLATTFPVEYVVTDLAHTTQTRGTSLDWAFYHKKTAVSIECGVHSAPSSVIRARHAITHFVSMSKRSPTHIHPPPRVMKCLSSEKVRKGFRYVVPVRAFDRIEYGQVVAKDDEGEIRCDIDTFEGGAIIIMPTHIPYLGEEAFFWAVPEKTLNRISPQAR